MTTHFYIPQENLEEALRLQTITSGQLFVASFPDGTQAYSIKTTEATVVRLGLDHSTDWSEFMKGRSE